MGEKQVSTTPLGWWKSRTPMEKFLDLNRWSISSFLVLNPFYLAIFLSSWPTSWEWVLVGLCFGASAVAIYTVETHPQLHVRAIPRPADMERISVACNLAAAALSLLLYAIAPPQVSREVSFLTFLWALFNLMQAHLPFRAARTQAIWSVPILAVFVFVALIYSWVTVAMVLYLSIISFMLWTVRLVAEAQRTAVLEAQLDDSTRRLRMAQNVHDTLGQHLALISIKAQLAAKYAARGDKRVLSELDHVQEITQEASRDLHAVVHQERSPELEVELYRSRSVLQAAGMTVSMTGEPEMIPHYAREVAAWFIRETATNIVRHSRAREVTIMLSPHEIVVVNDRPNAPAPGEGTGVAGLKARARSIDATVNTKSTDDSFEARLCL